MNDDYLMESATGEQAQLDDAGEDTGTDAGTPGVFEEGQNQDAAEDNGTPTDLAREREMRIAAEARNKTMQGQYDSIKRGQAEIVKSREETAQLRESHSLMQAQLEDMRALVAMKVAETPEEPVFDETLKGFLGDQSAGFEQALTRAAAKAAAVVRAEADQKIAALSAQLAEVQKKNQSVPFDMLRNSDSVYDEAGFAEFISAEKDPIFGVSIKEQMAQLHSQGKDVIPALKRARDAYVAKRGTAAPAEQPNVTPRLSTAGGVASKPQSTKVDIKSLQAEYDGYRKTNLAKDRPRRLEIMLKLAQNGIL